MDITVRITVDDLLEKLCLKLLEPSAVLVTQDQDEDGAITVVLKDCEPD